VDPALNHRRFAQDLALSGVSGLGLDLFRPVEFLTESMWPRWAGSMGAVAVVRAVVVAGRLGAWADYPTHGEGSRLGFAVQLATVRMLGRFLPDPAKPRRTPPNSAESFGRHPGPQAQNTQRILRGGRSARR
jgi:hypothetical protein